ncbi:hypothetical protein SB6419_05368 [Klebsiella spallanzanii]|nr:hypothetical protein SB6419_05368 [Klebsiella spallanzanii]
MAANGFRQRALNTPGIGIVVGAYRLHRTGDAVRHICPVMGLSMLVVDFGRDAVDIVIHRRPVIFQTQAPAAGLAGLVRGADNAVTAGVPGIVMGVVGFMVVIEGAGQLMFVIRLPDPGGHKGVRVPVCRIGINGPAVIFRFLAVATAVDEDPAQGFVAAGDGDAVVPAAVRGIIAAAVAEGAGFARMQIVICGFRAEGDVAADGAVGGLG